MVTSCDDALEDGSLAAGVARVLDRRVRLRRAPSAWGSARARRPDAPPRRRRDAGLDGGVGQARELAARDPLRLGAQPGRVAARDRRARRRQRVGARARRPGVRAAEEGERRAAGRLLRRAGRSDRARSEHADRAPQGQTRGRHDGRPRAPVREESARGAAARSGRGARARALEWRADPRAPHRGQRRREPARRLLRGTAGDRRAPWHRLHLRRRVHAGGARGPLPGVGLARHGVERRSRRGRGRVRGPRAGRARARARGRHHGLGRGRHARPHAHLQRPRRRERGGTPRDAGRRGDRARRRDRPQPPDRLPAAPGAARAVSLLHARGRQRGHDRQRPHERLPARSGAGGAALRGDRLEEARGRHPREGRQGRDPQPPALAGGRQGPAGEVRLRRSHGPQRRWAGVHLRLHRARELRLAHLAAADRAARLVRPARARPALHRRRRVGFARGRGHRRPGPHLRPERGQRPGGDRRRRRLQGLPRGARQREPGHARDHHDRRQGHGRHARDARAGARGRGRGAPSIVGHPAPARARRERHDRGDRRARRPRGRRRSALEEAPRAHPRPPARLLDRRARERRQGHRPVLVDEPARSHRHHQPDLRPALPVEGRKLTSGDVHADGETPLPP